MIRLNLKNTPQTLDLGFGVTVTVAPLTSAVFAVAREDAGLPEWGSVPNQVYTVELVKAVARLTITAWDGVGDEHGVAVDPSPERIGQLLDIWDFYRAFNDLFVGKALLLLVEGNGSAPLPNGTLAGALDTAQAATTSAPPAPMS